MERDSTRILAGQTIQLGLAAMAVPLNIYPRLPDLSRTPWKDDFDGYPKTSSPFVCGYANEDAVVATRMRKRTMAHGCCVDTFKLRWKSYGCDRKPFDPLRFLENFKHTSISFLLWRLLLRRRKSKKNQTALCHRRVKLLIHKLSFQGMLQCTWKDGLLHHVFSIDDQTEVYVGNSSKVESSNNKILDYVYTFHSRKNSKNMQELEPECVGTSDPKNKLHIPNHTHRKNKSLTKKVANAFHSYKQRSSSKF